MSDGEGGLLGGVDTSPEGETREAAAHDEVRDEMPPVTASREAPEGIAPVPEYYETRKSASRNNGHAAAADHARPDNHISRTARDSRSGQDDAAGPSPEDLPPLPAKRYLDREESWLRFNQRVLELAEDASVPLLERVRFRAIVASNLDEFFMVRVAGLMRRMAAGLPVEGVSVRLPGQVLNGTLELAGRLTARHAACFTERILPALTGEGIEVLR